MGYLDNTGLAYFWEKIKSNFFPGTKEIPANADLNDYVLPGAYNSFTRGGKQDRIKHELPILLLRHEETIDSPELWRKQKGFGYVDYEGESYRAELHWYNHPKTGNVEFKIKPDAGGNWFYDEY